MDTVLQGIPHVICYIDDILITGANTADHLRNLASVLQRLQHYGFRLKKEKCEFLRPSVDYLGHRIDAEGLHAMPSKLQAIFLAPTPKNTQELRSFWGYSIIMGSSSQIWLPDTAAEQALATKSELEMDHCLRQGISASKRRIILIQSSCTLRPSVATHPSRRCFCVWHRSCDLTYHA